LLNPIEALTAQMVGVSSVSVLEKLAEVAAELGKNILFVHDSEFGLDDVSIGGETVFAKVQDGEVETGKFVPEDYDVQRILSFDEISGGNVETNFEIFDSLVKGTALEGYQNFLRINQVVAEDFFKKF
ncbi:MAG: hypothetical protein OEL89_04220, partial [Candidatus Peregrinibacteria bacterium]|nr:hypothetical protein [Candidatus Peregrinibacteria bacterium]